MTNTTTPHHDDESTIDPLDRAADRLRDSAKWLMASFGAVALVIFAGLTVADISTVSQDAPGYRKILAAVSALAAIGGIVAALIRAMRLAGASTTTLDDLLRTPGDAALDYALEASLHDPALTTWGKDPRSFLDDYNTAFDRYVLHSEAFAADVAKYPDPSELNKARWHLEAFEQIARRILTTVSFLRLQREFERARIAMAVWVLVAAAGAIGFGWATAQDEEDSDPVLTATPVAGVLRPGPDSVADLNRQLPQSCQVTLGTEIPVIALAQTLDDEFPEVELVTVPASACPPVRLSAPRDEVTGA